MPTFAKMVKNCPYCGSAKLRPSQSLSFTESVMEWLGVLSIRCRDCDARFRSIVWDIPNLIYAHCPRCYGLELTTWNPEKYHIPARWKLLIRMGAWRHRCDSCRCNFVSFRRRKVTARRRTEPSRPHSMTQAPETPA